MKVRYINYIHVYNFTMFVEFHREKLLNAVLYFVENTKHCHTLKLFKLLNFLDFEHYRQTGKRVTNLDYQALPMGPVPISFWEEMKNPPDDLESVIDIHEIPNELTGQLARRDIKPKKQFDARYFSKRELEIMDRLAFFFAELKAEDMSEFSHEPKLPWRKVFKKGAGQGHIIPFELAFDSRPMVKERPTIEKEELDYYKEALEE